VARALAVAAGRAGHGFALAPNSTPSLFDRLGPLGGLTSRIGDLRDLSAVAAAVAAAKPTIALHMAAQPLVRLSYREPVETFASNVMGTAHVLQALRESPDLRAVVVITSDKVYRNDESGRAFAEDDALGGHDPYSASKAATDIATASWASSFYEPKGIPLVTARAGNVIGGGDWAEDRLIPDLWRAAKAGERVVLRNPAATRPWQHVLEPLGGYLVYAQQLAMGAKLPHTLNFGPEANDVMTVGAVAQVISQGLSVPNDWELAQGPQPAEMKFLAIDPALAGRTLGWKLMLSTPQALEWTADWYRAFNGGASAAQLCADQISAFERLLGAR